jgi:hypothetical protein
MSDDDRRWRRRGWEPPTMESRLVTKAPWPGYAPIPMWQLRDRSERRR